VSTASGQKWLATHREQYLAYQRAYAKEYRRKKRQGIQPAKPQKHAKRKEVELRDREAMTGAVDLDYLSWNTRISEHPKGYDNPWLNDQNAIFGKDK
jgi:hypothetical protein